MIRAVKITSALSLILLCVFAFTPGCEVYTRTDGSKVNALSPATTQAVGTVGNTAGYVAVTTPPGSPVNTAATIIMGIAGIILGVDGMRKQSNSGKLAGVVTQLNEIVTDLVRAKSDDNSTPKPPVENGQ